MHLRRENFLFSQLRTFVWPSEKSQDTNEKQIYKDNVLGVSINNI